MGTTFSIGALAKAAGVPTSTVRYYERIGLVQPSGRTPSGYRVFDEAGLERLRFIRSATATGLTLEDAGLLLDLRDGVRGPCGDVQQMLERRLAGIEKRLDDLLRVRAALGASLEDCQAGEPSGRCEVIDQLSYKSTQAP